MTSTTNYRRGDIFVVDIPFTDGTGSKRRPSLIVSAPVYHRSRQQVIVFPFTGNTRRLHAGAYLVSDWRSAGFKRPSATMGILVTVNRSRLERKVGSVTGIDMEAIEALIKRILRLAD